MKKIIIFLFLIIILNNSIKAQQISELFDYKALLGKWEMVNADKNSKEKFSFNIKYDQKRNCLLLDIFPNLFIPLHYDCLSKTLRYRIVGKGPTGDLEEFKIIDKRLIECYYSVKEQKWIKGKEYQKVK